MSKITHRELHWAIRDLIDEGLDSKSKLLLYTAHACCDSNFRFSWGQSSLCEVTCLSRRSVQSAVNNLIKLEYISRTRRGNSYTNSSNEYRLNIFKIANSITLRKYKKQSNLSATVAHPNAQNSTNHNATVAHQAYCISDRAANTAIPLSGVSVATVEDQIKNSPSYLKPDHTFEEWLEWSNRQQGVAK